MKRRISINLKALRKPDVTSKLQTEKLDAAYITRCNTLLSKIEETKDDENFDYEKHLVSLFYAAAKVDSAGNKTLLNQLINYIQINI